MKCTTMVCLLLVVLVGTATADRPWAPGVHGQSSSSSSSNLPDIWLRVGPSFVSTNSDRLGDDGEFHDVSLKGLDLAAGINVLNSSIGENSNLNVNIPLFTSLLTGVEPGYGEETGLLLLGRIVPTLTLSFGLKSGLVVAPYFGAGAGTNLNIIGGYSEDFQFVKTIRLGADLMLKPSLGLGIGYSINSISGGVIVEGKEVTYDWGSYKSLDWKESESLSLKALTFSVLFKL